MTRIPLFHFVKLVSGLRFALRTQNAKVSLQYLKFKEKSGRCFVVSEVVISFLCFLEMFFLA